ncbi:MAG: cell division protein FtsQ/DivIB [Pseudomonadota bacterium]|nr:cell division protein FtsQ/DivIB [Pseudomonadota bacterium]
MAKRLTYKLRHPSRLRERPRWLHWRFWLPGVLFAATLTLGWTSWQWVYNPANLPIAHVYIKAPYQHVTREVVEAKITPCTQPGFVGMNIAELQQSVKELPWIAKVMVQRVWPDAVVVTLEEQQAVARWSKLGVLNPQGEIFYPALDSVPEGLPLLRGPDAMSKTILTSYQNFSKLLATEDLKLKAIKVNARRAWELTLENDIVIKLGRTDLEPRLQRLIKAWPKLTKDRKEPIVTIDLRYPNGMAVR